MNTIMQPPVKFILISQRRKAIVIARDNGVSEAVLVWDTCMEPRLKVSKKKYRN